MVNGLYSKQCLCQPKWDGKCGNKGHDASNTQANSENKMGKKKRELHTRLVAHIINNRFEVLQWQSVFQSFS